MTQTVRKQVTYRGRVQGVGFRATTAAIAGRFRVTGFVRNLSDGSVELVVEGELGPVEDFLAAVAERFRRNITDQERRDLAVTDEPLKRFSVRH